MRVYSLRIIFVKKWILLLLFLMMVAQMRITGLWEM